MEAQLVLRQCRLIGQEELVDIAIADQYIEAIAPHLPMTGVTELIINGRLVSAPFVESHIHLDSVMTAGEPRWNESGTLFEGIDIWRDRKSPLTLDDVKARAIKTLKQQASYGVLFVRSHADVSEASLTALKGLLEVREAVKDWMTLQVVAFPQDGLYGSPKNEDLMEEALKLGADAVGGIPHYELTREDGVRAGHRIFELAEQYDRLIDIHCDDIDDPQSRFLEVMAACTLRRDMGSRVSASHTTAFGSYNDAYALNNADKLAKELHERFSQPLYAIAFGLIVFAFLGKARTTRQGRGSAIVGAIACCVILRTSGFGVTAIAGVSNALLSLLYVVPIAGSALALVSIFNDRRAQPRWLNALHLALQDRLEAIGNRLNNRQAGGAS